MYTAIYYVEIIKIKIKNVLGVYIPIPIFGWVGKY